MPTPQLRRAHQPTAAAQETVVARVYFNDITDLNQFAVHLDIWEVHHHENPRLRYFVALLTTDEVTTLRAQGYRVEIDRARSAQLTQPVQSAAPQAGIPGFPCYRTVAETYATLAALAETHPNLATWVDIGDSWDKVNSAGAAGYDLQALVLTNHNHTGPKPVFFLMAAIHARELVTAEIATRFAEYLVDNYGKDADVTWLLDYTEIHIVAESNPDGRVLVEEMTSSLRWWRKNTNSTTCPNAEPTISSYGVDLNRNSSFKWNQCQGSGCSSGQGCFITYRGESPASEPETQALQAYIGSIFPDQRGPADTDPAPADATGLLISLHSYSELVLFPWGWSDVAAPNRTQLATLGRKFGYFTGYQVCQAGELGCIYQTDGSTDDWSYGELGVASYTFELGTDFFQQCGYFESVMMGKTMPALLYAAKAARRPYQTPAGPETLQLSTTLTTTQSGPMLQIVAQADDTRYASHGWGSEPTQAIAGARLTIDAPAWITTTQSYTMTAVDGAFDAAQEVVTGALDITTWAPGRYQLFIESEDADGNWGTPSSLFFEIHRLFFPVVMK